MLTVIASMLIATLPATQQSAPIRLWEGDAPGARGSQEVDIPTLTPILPTGKANGTALVICPGGGYGMLAGHEGVGYADFFTKSGITCFVLKYRLGSSGYRHPVMLQDVSRAMRLVRSRAKEFGIKKNKVGVIGSSAGGHLASTILTHYDKGDRKATDPIERESSRPDYGILCYAVISLGQFTHQGSKHNLLGDNPDPSLVQLLSNEKQVTSNTPPTFIWSLDADNVVPVQNSIAFADALKAAKVPYELHTYPGTQHGTGIGKPDPWTQECLRWLGERGFLKKSES